jgi:hypothetical protein
MPNGRSGGFPIETGTLKDVVGAASDAAPVGLIFDASSGPRFRPVGRSEVLRLIEDCPSARVAVEEQDHSSYIIHLRDEPSLGWVSVSPESPIFSELRQFHDQWKIEHPDWNGWIGF